MSETVTRAGEIGKQAALDALRTAIGNGDVAPGQRLVETELAERFGVSRASLRAALIDLTAEGLVERIPNRGARVRVITVDEAVAITECRMALEGLCASKAAEKATDAQIEILQTMGDNMAKAVDTGDAVKYSSLNRALHQFVREIADQPVANDLLQRLQQQIVRHQFRLALRPGRPQQSLTEHLAIIRGIADHDPDAAEAAARAHLRSVIEALKQTKGNPR